MGGGGGVQRAKLAATLEFPTLSASRGQLPGNQRVELGPAAGQLQVCIGFSTHCGDGRTGRRGRLWDRSRQYCHSEVPHPERRFALISQTLAVAPITTPEKDQTLRL